MCSEHAWSSGNRHDIVVPEGTRIDTFVDGDHLIGAETEGRPPLPPAPARSVALTNEEVVALHKAGFGEEVILAKIAASPAAFHVAATDMVALKQSGLSDRVVAAMVAAK